MTKYGTKDLMRIQDIQKKANGDFIEEVKLAVRMANEIEEPGKAVARGHASIAVYGNYSPVSGIFYQRACKLSGEANINDIQTMASMNSVNGEDALEDAYSQIPIENQPASRRNPDTWEKSKTSNKRGFSDISVLGKINVVKGIGPGFEMKYMRNGTMEVWKNSDEKYRLVYTANSIPISAIGEQKDFKFEGKRETWTMVDYIETYNMLNLMPLYGTSITSYMYS